MHQHNPPNDLFSPQPSSAPPSRILSLEGNPMVASSDAKSVPDPSQREGGEQMNLMDDGRNLEHSAVELSRNDLDSPDAVLSTTKTMTTPLESVASVPVTPESTAYNNEEEAQVMKAEQRSKVDADPSGMDPTESTPVSRRSGRGLIIARVQDLQAVYEDDLRNRAQHVPFMEFLRFLLGTLLWEPQSASQTNRDMLDNTLKRLLEVAVEVCNAPGDIIVEDKDLPSFSGVSKGYKMNEIQELLLNYRNVGGGETARYAPWVKLSNAILAALCCQDVSDRVTDAGLSALPDFSAESLLFQRNDDKAIKSVHTGVDGHRLAQATYRKPDVLGLSIASALKTTQSVATKQQLARKRAMKPPKNTDQTRDRKSRTMDQGTAQMAESGEAASSPTGSSAPEKQLGRPAEFWAQAWKDHASGPAPLKPYAAPTWEDVLLGVEFKKKRTSNMQKIPKSFEAGTSDMTNETLPLDGNLDDYELEIEPTVEPSVLSGKRASGSQAKGSDKKLKTNSGRAVPNSRSTPANDGAYDNESHTLPDSAQTSGRLHPSVQIAVYASERLSCRLPAHHALEAIVIDDNIWLWWFDHGGAIQSCGLNFVSNLPIFVALLAILQRFDRERWGYDSTFKQGPREKTYNITLFGIPNQPEGDQPEVEVTIIPGKIPLSLDLFSRASSVVPAECTSNHLYSDSTLLRPGHELVAKIYHPNENRTNEVDLLAHAYRAAAANDDNARNIRGHVPIVLAERTWNDDTADIMEEVLGIKRKGDRKQFRKLRVLLFIKLRPIWELSGREFIKVFRDCFLCHGALWNRGLHHRDISEGNLMYMRIGDVVIGVVNDYDLSVLNTDQRDLGKERTGTIPFMAGKLLQMMNSTLKLPHLYVYDLESFAYVLLWITCRYDNGKLIKGERPYSIWTTTPHLDTLARIKYVDLLNVSNSDAAISASHQEFDAVITEFCSAMLRRIFPSPLEARRKKPRRMPSPALLQTFPNISSTAQEQGSPATICAAHRDLYDSGLEDCECLEWVLQQVKAVETMYADAASFSKLAECWDATKERRKVREISERSRRRVRVK